jgi:ferric-chelate reductase (NADPH)
VSKRLPLAINPLDFMHHLKLAAKRTKKLRSARIEEVESIGDGFRLIGLVAKGCRGLKWQPGGKLKIAIGDREARTYTPIAIDAKSGRVRILAYINGQSPASQ